MYKLSISKTMAKNQQISFTMNFSTDCFELLKKPIDLMLFESFDIFCQNNFFAFKSLFFRCISIHINCSYRYLDLALSILSYRIKTFQMYSKKLVKILK